MKQGRRGAQEGSMAVSLEEMRTLLGRLVEARGPAGFEEEVRGVIVEEIKNYAEEIAVDPLGNLIARLPGPREEVPKVMFCAHMDEVGLMVKHVDDQGYVIFELHGYLDERILLTQWVRIHTRKGQVVGVIGVKGRHLLSPEELGKVPSFREMWIDVGASSAGEAREMGIRPGDPITFDRGMSPIGRDRVLSRALDNRIGCAVLVQSMKELSKDRLRCTVHPVFSVQEETGARGAQTAAYQVQPDLAVALDTSYGVDPSVSAKRALPIGQGPTIRVMDMVQISNRGCVTPAWLRDLAIDVAERNAIPYQLDVTTNAWVDTSTIHLTRGGVPSIGLLVARRNSHAPAEVASLSDMMNAVKLVTAFTRALGPETIPGGIRRIK